MPISAEQLSRVEQARAILFDLNDTIAKTRTDVISWCRVAAERAGIDLSDFSDDEITVAFDFSNKMIQQHMTKGNAGIHWGNDPDDWFEINTAFFNHLGLEDVTSEQVLQFEMNWRGTGDDSFEILVDDAGQGGIRFSRAPTRLNPDGKTIIGAISKRLFLSDASSDLEIGPAKFIIPPDSISGYEGSERQLEDIIERDPSLAGWDQPTDGI